MMSNIDQKIEIEVGKIYLASQNKNAILVIIQITHYTPKAVGYILGDNDVIGYKVMKKGTIYPKFVERSTFDESFKIVEEIHFDDILFGK